MKELSGIVENPNLHHIPELPEVLEFKGIEYSGFVQENSVVPYFRVSARVVVQPVKGRLPKEKPRGLRLLETIMLGTLVSPVVIFLAYLIPEGNVIGFWVSSVLVCLLGFLWWLSTEIVGVEEFQELEDKVAKEPVAHSNWGTMVNIPIPRLIDDKGKHQKMCGTGDFDFANKMVKTLASNQESLGVFHQVVQAAIPSIEVTVDKDDKLNVSTPKQVRDSLESVIKPLIDYSVVEENVEEVTLDIRNNMIAENIRGLGGVNLWGHKP